MFEIAGSVHHTSVTYYVGILSTRVGMKGQVDYYITY